MGDYVVLRSHIIMSNQLCGYIAESSPIDGNSIPILNETYINRSTDTHELRLGKRIINPDYPIVEALFEWIRIEDNLVVRRLQIKWETMVINNHRSVIVIDDWNGESKIKQFDKSSYEFTTAGLTDMFNLLINE